MNGPCYVSQQVFIASHDPSWTKATCERYVLFPEALKVVTSFVIGGNRWTATCQTNKLNESTVIFILRLYAIYSLSYLIAAFGAVLLVGELAVKIVSHLPHAEELCIDFRLVCLHRWHQPPLTCRWGCYWSIIWASSDSDVFPGLVGCILVGRNQRFVLSAFFAQAVSFSRSFLQTICLHLDRWTCLWWV